MYPELSDFINDVFGVDPALPFSSFGTILGLAFVIGYLLFAAELWRKEKEGQIAPVVRNADLTKKWVIFSKYLFSGVSGFVIGHKLIGAIYNYQEFVHNPGTFLFSIEGNLIGGSTGTIIGLLFCYYNVASLNKRPQKLVNHYQMLGKMSLMASVFCLVGARLFHYIENPDELITNPLESLISGGLNIYGGLIFGGLYIFLFIRQNKLDLLHYGDACAPALMISYGIARIGCHISGDGDWGIPNDHPKPDNLFFIPDWLWSYDYADNALNIDLISFYKERGFESVLGRAWPTPLYEFMICFLFFIVLWYLRKKKLLPGTLFSLYLILNGIERFSIEWIRINPRYTFLKLSFSMAQYISLILLLLGIYGLWYFNYSKKNPKSNQIDAGIRSIN
ncbi:MAG: prolipoprotein diacylglyceryl transferase [Cytophagales bacterium]|nr:prolipoprotein diacylglyceryl transferase [Cytophagales bacterium]